MRPLLEQTLFFLKPKNGQADMVLQDNHNEKYISHSADGVARLNIGPFSNHPKECILATLGRSHADIRIRNRAISRTQCIFEINPESQIIILRDTSTNQSTQVVSPKGPDWFRINHMRLPRIIIHPWIPGIELVMGMGPTEPLRFALEWKDRTGDNNIETVFCDIPLHSSRERTLYDVDKSESNSFAVRLYLEERKRPRIYWISLSMLGKGSFGSVVRGLDYHHGNWYAVKQIKGFNLEDGYPKEYKIIKRMNHDHILSAFHCQEEQHGFAIFLPIRDGTVEDLLHDKSIYLNQLAEDVLYQMLQALKYLEAQGLIHYDVKPGNILYQRKSGATYHLELSDFGLSEYCYKKVGLRGTNPYIAPEIFDPCLGQPTSRVDVWSLFVTVARHLNRKFCDEIVHLQDPKAIIEAVLSIREDPACLRIRSMAETCPTKRPSAETVLKALFSMHMEWQPDPITGS